MKLETFLAKSEPVGFEPAPYYSPESDSLTFFLQDGDQYAQRIDSILTVFLDTQTDDLVGWKIKGVKRLTGILGTFDVLIDDDRRMSLGPFLLAGLTLTEAKCRVYYERCCEASRGVLLSESDLRELGV